MQLTKMSAVNQLACFPLAASHRETLTLNNLSEGTTLSGLGHIPLQHVLLANSRLQTQINGTTTTASESTNDQHSRLPSSLRDDLLNVRNQLALIRIRGHGSQSLALVDLLSPGLYSQSRTSETSMVSESRDPTTALILQELKIVKSTLTSREAGQNLLPSTLVLVAVGELNVCVLEGEGVFGKLLETKDNMVGGSVNPGTFRDQRAANGSELFIVKDALRGALDYDFVSGIEEGLSRCGGNLTVVR